MATAAPLLLDHVINPNHDALGHSAVFSGPEGNLFCVHCASERYKSAPDFRRLALLDGISIILKSHGPQYLHDSIDACLPMLLQGIDSVETGIMRLATDNVLALKGELPDPVGLLASLVSRAVSFGLPRASGHLYLIGQLLTNASQDQAFSAALGHACIGTHYAPMTGTGGGNPSRSVEDQFRGFGSFLAAQAVSVSCPDNVKSDVLYIAMELVDCCATPAYQEDRARTHDMGAHSSLPSPGEDPFVCIMFAIPRLLVRRSSCDESIQLHSVAFLAAATAYCCNRTKAGVPGWFATTAGVPEVLATLFDVSGSGDHESMGGASSSQPSSGGMCGTLKTLLMSSSYPVRSATARLISSLCSDGSSSVDGAGNTSRAGCFFREALIAARTTDFLFEAIKSEREGTPRYYLDAAEALALSPVEFFHIDNFSMKFVAPILLGASRGQGVGGGVSAAHAGDPLDRVGRINGEEDEASAFASSSRLLLQALVAVPASSSIGIVEELLATAAASIQSETSKVRAIGVAADVLSLILSGDVPLSKDQREFIGAVEVLLGYLEEDLMHAASSGYNQPEVSPPTCAEQVPSLIGAPGPSDTSMELDQHGDDGLLVQTARVMENLLHLVEEWVASQGCLEPPSQPTRYCADVTGDVKYTREEGVALSDLVFGAYERSLAHQYELTARSGNFAHDIAFLSCMGAAIDASSAALRRRLAEATSSKDEMAALLHMSVRAHFFGAEELKSLAQEDGFVQTLGKSIGRGAGDAIGGQGMQKERPGSTETHDTVNPASASYTLCLETILRTAVEADTVSWILKLYARCGVAISASAEPHFHGVGDNNFDDVETDVTPPQSLTELNSTLTCFTTTRELLEEVLHSFLYAQGWINGLCTGGLDGPSQVGQVGAGSGGDEMHRDAMSGSLDSPFGETVRLVLQSWNAAEECGRENMALDQHVMSLLGTSADNGNLLKLAVILVSLSPVFLGVLHPHQGCRVDSAVTLFRYVKTLPEAIFCLNLFSHVVLKSGHSGASPEARPCRLHDNLSDAIQNVLARFPVVGIAFYAIPLSADALAFAVRAGCVSFLEDWLLAAPLGRISGALKELGVPRGQRVEYGTSDPARLSEGEAGVGKQDKAPATIPAAGRDQIALAGILEAAVSRWESAVTKGPQVIRTETAIHRLSRVILMLPDTFFCLAFNSDPGRDQTRERGDTRGERGNQYGDSFTMMCTLGAILPTTLERLSVALSPAVLLRKGNSGIDDWTSELVCTSQVSRLAVVFLRAQCARRSCIGSNTAHWASLRRALPEAALARACGGILAGLLDPRRGQGRGGRESLNKDTCANAALRSVFNLFSALLVLSDGDSDLRHANEALESALREVHAALLEALAPIPAAIERLACWLDHAPQTLAAFLQACVIWNNKETASSAISNIVAPSCKRLAPSFQVLDSVLSSCICRSYHAEHGTTSNIGSIENGAPPSQAECSVLLKVLASRCIESIAPTRPFCRQEVLTLQLELQDIACDSSATLASAAYGAIQALWEAYAGILQPCDLVEQSWNPFMVEVCLENALRFLARSENDANKMPQPEGGNPGNSTNLRFGEDPETYWEDAADLITAIGRLLRCSVGKQLPQRKRSIGSDDCTIGILSTTAFLHVQECVTFLSTSLCTSLDNGLVGIRPGVNGADRGVHTTSNELCQGGGGGAVRSDVMFHVLGALEQLVQVLLCIEPRSKYSSAAKGEGQQELVDALSRLHVSLLESLKKGNAGNVSQGTQQGALPPLGGLSCEFEGGRSFSSEVTLFVRHCRRRAASWSLRSLTWTKFAVDVKTLVGRLLPENLGEPGGCEE